MMIEKIDTQGMSLPIPEGYAPSGIQSHKPMEVKHIPILESKLRQEIKDLINEVLDERELYKKPNYSPYRLDELQE
tara:strand:- start:557 stop:784 length:228 start_codon:yes stop_codon:yes gene_type:complete